MLKVGKNMVRTKEEKLAQKRIDNKKYRESHRGQIKAHYSATRDTIILRKNEYYKAHTDEAKAYREAHKDEIKLKNKLWEQQHKEERTKYRKHYIDTHKEEQKKYNEEHKEDKKAAAKAYRLTHKEEPKQYYEANKERLLSEMKKYYEKNKERIKSTVNTYNNNNIEMIKSKAKIRYKENQSTYLKRRKLYKQTPQGKVVVFRSHAKRKRDFGFNPLNHFVQGYHGHHIDLINVIFIPKELHIAIPHKQKDESSMLIINILAWAYMESSVY
jgi:hypothetical protein